MKQIFSWINRVKKTVDYFSDLSLKTLYCPSFVGDGLATFGKSAGFLKDEPFASALDHQAFNYMEKSRAWRLHTLCWAGRQALRVDGDFVECGVFNGFMSSVVMETLQFQNQKRTFWLYDSFEGFSEKYTKPEDFARGQLFIDVAQQDYKRKGLYEEVVARFEKYSNVKITKGFLPDTLDIAEPDRISYLHVDLNSPQAELLTLKRLFPKVVRGGVVIFDDYGWANFRKQKETIDAFMENEHLTVLDLPTGQGLVVRN